MSKNDSKLSDDAVAAWARLVRVSQSLLSAVDADLKAQGLPSLIWYDALLELKRAGSRGLRPFELQQEMLLAQYNLSRLSDRLVKAGYAERLPCDDDGRGFVLRITAPGRNLLKKMWPVYRTVLRRRFADKLDDGEVKALAAILGKLA